MIGREGELTAVQAFLDQPIDGVRALVFEGEPGIGKSTLWQAAVDECRRRSFRSLVARPAENEQRLPNVVLGDLFTEVTPDALAELPAPRRRAFEAALLREGTEAPIDPRALGVAIVTLLAEMAATRPLVIAVDDDQWTDASSEAALNFALRRLAGHPVLLLLSRRAGRPSGATLETAIDPARVLRLAVGPLSLGALQLVLRDRLGVVFPRGMLVRLHEASAGNPFYALELARAHAMDSPDRGLYPSLPPTLEALVGARLASLDGDTRDALLLVAAHGRLPQGVLASLGVARASLQPAFAAAVIEVRDGAIGFTHPLLASAVYNSATTDDRQAAHRRLASVVADEVHRARHRASGAEEPDADVADGLELGARIARDRGMALAAAELWEEAVRLTPAAAAGDATRRRAAAARAYRDAGDGQSAKAIAAELLAAAAPGEARAEALILLAEVQAPGYNAAVEPLLTEALDHAATTPRLRAKIHSGLAEAGRVPRGGAWAEDHATESLRLAEELDDDGLRATSLLAMARMRYERGDASALDLTDRARRLAEDRHELDLDRIVSMWTADALTWWGEPRRAHDWIERELEAWSDRDETVRWQLLWDLAWLETFGGQWEAARDHADQARVINDAYGVPSPQIEGPVAVLDLHRGQLDLARASVERALAVPGGEFLPYLDATLAICELWSGNASAALEVFERAERTADFRGWLVPNLRWWFDWHAEALLQAGRIDEAEQLIDRWESAAKRMNFPRAIAQARRCRGLIAAARGETTIAAALLEEGAQRHEDLGDRFGRSRALLALGVVLRRSRQKRSARVALEEAMAGFEALGAAGWVTTAREEIARISGRTRFEGLSPSEFKVAALAADGHTNREIAAALFLGERTVASHLTRIYSKLGVRSRTELARQSQPNAVATEANIQTS